MDGDGEEELGDDDDDDLDGPTAASECPPDLMDMLDMCAGRSAGPSKSSPTPKVSTKAAAQASKGEGSCESSAHIDASAVVQSRAGRRCSQGEAEQGGRRQLGDREGPAEGHQVCRDPGHQGEQVDPGVPHLVQGDVGLREGQEVLQVRQQQDTLDSKMAVASEAQKQQLNEVHKHLGSIVGFIKAYKNLVRKGGEEGYIKEKADLLNFAGQAPQIDFDVPVCISEDEAWFEFSHGLVEELREACPKKMQARWSVICMGQLQKFMGSDLAATFQQRAVEEAIITLLGAAADPQDMNETMVLFHRFLSPVPSSNHIADLKLEPGTFEVLQTSGALRGWRRRGAIWPTS